MSNPMSPNNRQIENLVDLILNSINKKKEPEYFICDCCKKTYHIDDMQCLNAEESICPNCPATMSESLKEYLNSQHL